MKEMLYTNESNEIFFAVAWEYNEPNTCEVATEAACESLTSLPPRFSQATAVKCCEIFLIS